jgi:hypothetical protein
MFCVIKRHQSHCRIRCPEATGVLIGNGWRQGNSRGSPPLDPLPLRRQETSFENSDIESVDDFDNPMSDLYTSSKFLKFV